MSEVTFNPSSRRLCPDGACIGVIGADGRCRVCGRAGDGAATTESASADDARNQDFHADLHEDRHEDRHDHADADADADGEGDGRAASGEQGGGGFRPDRRLCDDGSCVGVIGAGDVCSVCGRAAGS